MYPHGFQLSGKVFLFSEFVTQNCFTTNSSINLHNSTEQTGKMNENKNGLCKTSNLEVKIAYFGTLLSKLESNNSELAIHSGEMQFTNMLENTEIFLKKIEKSR